MFPKVRNRSFCASVLLAFLLILLGSSLRGLAQSSRSQKQKVILDTDIGDDIDDAFALGLVLSSPELQLMGVTTAWGDTQLRARLAERMLCETGQQDIPVFVGVPTKTAATFTQAAWAGRFPSSAVSKLDAIAWMAQTIRQNPGEITLIEIAPESNIGALIEKDPAAFHMLKRVVLMGGSIRRDYEDLGYEPDHGPAREYNIAMDTSAAQKLFTSGVPIYVLPLDSTQLKLDAGLQNIVFRQSTPLTDSLALLTEQWSAGKNSATPTLFDVMAVAAAIDEKLCPFQRMHIRVDDQGFTRAEPGAANAFVCLNSDSDVFFHFLIPRLIQQSLEPTAPEPCSAKPSGR